jgi:peroxiredoxin family protein
MSQTVNPRLRRVLMEIVENQLRDQTPPETAETLARLVAEDYSRERAMELIACVVTSEIFDILKKNELYNEARYIAGLRALPHLPWDGEEDDE